MGSIGGPDTTTTIIQSTNQTTVKRQQPIQLSDFVGEHGAYQLSITLILFVRYVLLGLMANSGPLMTPDVTFYCHLPIAEVLAIMPNISTLSRREQELEIKEEFKRICQIDLHLYHNQSNLFKNSSRAFKPAPASLVQSPNMTQHRPASSDPRIRECTDFTYELATDQGRTMTSEFDLVCERDWLRSLFQSLISAAIVVAHVFWGTFSDKYGRYQAQRLCLLVSLVAGGLSIVAVDFWTFTLARALCSFGDLGLVVSLTTTVVELVGTRYRGLSVAMVNFGYALGVTLLPYIVAYFEDFRLVVGFTAFCHIVTMPFILATNESVRWLMTNRKFKLARKELKRITRWNKSYSSLCEQILKFNCYQSGGDGQLEARQVSSIEQKRAFELLFNELIDQLESQNLCDPLYYKQMKEIDKTEPKTSSQVVVSNDGDKQEQHRSHETITRQAAANSSSGTPSPERDRKSVPISSAILSHHHHLRVPDIVVGSSMNRSLDALESKADWAPSGAKWHKLAPIGRTVSCSQLDAQSAFRHEFFNTSGSNSSHLDNKLKPLTLPPSSSLTASICHDNILQDDDDQSSELRRARHSEQPPDCINLVAHQLSFVGRVSRLFKDKKLMVAVFTIVWTTFNSELQYTSFIIINLEVGEDVYLNYILGGCMEALAAISASLLLSYAPRRHSLITFWLLISLSCFGLSIAHIDSTWAVWLLALAKFSQSCLSSIASVAAYESFPTSLRQSGSGLVFTLGMLGSVFAPLIFAEFDDHAGMDRVLMTFSVSSLTAAILIYLFLNETRDCELQ